MLSASKLCQSFSISGPAATRYPIRVKTSTIRSSTMAERMQRARRGRRPGSVTSTASASSSSSSRRGLELARRRASSAACSASRSLVGGGPTRRRSSGAQRRRASAAPRERGLAPQDARSSPPRAPRRVRAASNSARPRSSSCSRMRAGLGRVHGAASLARAFSGLPRRARTRALVRRPARTGRGGRARRRACRRRRGPTVPPCASATPRATNSPILLPARSPARGDGTDARPPPA